MVEFSVNTVIHILFICYLSIYHHRDGDGSLSTVPTPPAPKSSQPAASPRAAPPAAGPRAAPPARGPRAMPPAPVAHAAPPASRFKPLRKSA
jgi:hypothetical protein